VIIDFLLANKSATASSSLNTSKKRETPIARSANSTTIAHLAESTTLDKYIKNVHAMNRRTAVEYHGRLVGFQDFVIRSYKTMLDTILTRISKGSEDPYQILMIM
jgi:predicted RecB family nuclease